MKRFVIVLSAVLGALGLLATTACGPEIAQSSAPPELVVNGTFERGKDGWRTNQSRTTLEIRPGRDGRSAAVLTSPPGTIGVLNDEQNTVPETVAGESYTVAAWIRTNKPPLRGALRVREVLGEAVRPSAAAFALTGTEWTYVSLEMVAVRSGASLDLNIIGYDFAAGQELWIDAVSMRRTARARQSTTPTPAAAEHWRLSNGVELSERGIPARGALLGAAVGGNTDPTEFESGIGQRLGVRRTYWGPEQVDRAVETARTDLAAGRLPWISFKLPYAWSRMAAGDGDAWTRDLAQRLAELPGPVWVAFHHEPEGDGPIKDWKAMQERLGPIVRQTATNVAFTVILTGWNQLQGDARYALDRLWPHTTVDLAGFDIYNYYGTVAKDGALRREHTDLRRLYFDPISSWAAMKGIAWGVAESGLNDLAAVDDPEWLKRTFDELVASGGSAFCYFNSPHNSTTSWEITSKAKRKMFAKVIKSTPSFPKLS